MEIRIKFEYQIKMFMQPTELSFFIKKKIRFEVTSKNSTYRIIIIGHAKITNSRVEKHQPVDVSSYSERMFNNILFNCIRLYTKEFFTITPLGVKLLRESRTSSITYRPKLPS
jgi:hypothetical protein